MDPAAAATRHSRLARSFTRQARDSLSKDDYDQFIRVICKMHGSLLSPNSFREKIKYLFRNHHHIIQQLNSFVPEGYEFSLQELNQCNLRDYKYLDKYKAGIEFFNDLKHALIHSEPETARKLDDLVKLRDRKQIGKAEFYRRAASVESPEALREFQNFHDLVQSHKRKEIDTEEFYERAYKILEDHFDLIKQLSTILNYDPSLTPSYVRLPACRIQGITSCLSPWKRECLNNSLRVNDAMARTPMVQDDADKRLEQVHHLYNIDEVCLIDKPRSESAKRNMSASFWWEEKIYELDMLYDMLICAEEIIRDALDKVKNGEINGTRALWTYLVRRMKVNAMVKKMLGKLENLISAPHQTLPHVLNALRQRIQQVERARNQVSDKYS